jgi:murein L,D-transpeptidase YafK
MTLYSQQIPIKTYTISIGENPIGHKQKQGDNRTPEGLYTITDKNPNSAYYKNLGISYPSQKDKNQAKKNHVSPGGNIKIHGYTDTQGSSENRFVRYAYTWGCINVCNADMDEVYDWVKVGAVIYISP